MQSHNSSNKIPLPLPWGFGSMQWKGRVWQLTWRDPEGKVHYDGSGTADAAEAQRIMAERALPRARAMVEQLERIANGETYRQADQGTGGKRPGSRPVGAVGAPAAAAPRKAGGKGTRGGKA